MRTPLAVSCFAAVALGALLLSDASGQTPRNGIRIEYTTLDTTGGQARRVFLPVSSRDVSVQPPEDPDSALAALDVCPGAIEVRATARQRRGAIRSVALSLSVRDAATLPIDREACPGAFVETTLADGTVLSGGRGEVVVTNIVWPGRIAGFMGGRFTQTAMRNGTPVTIRGEFRIPISEPGRPGPSRAHIGS